jgi:glycosyltransferase involved in cell wall biosynthesis
MSGGRAPMRLLHVVSGLLSGGAEWMLHGLLRTLNREEFHAEVLSMSGTEPMGQKIAELGVPVRALGLARGRPNPAGLGPIVREIRRFRPDVIQTWMYHADLAGGIAALLVGRVPVVWGLHHASLDGDATKRTTLCAARACAALSRYLPRRIVCCSEATERIHRRIGYDAGRMIVIPNGFDTERFKPDPEARISVRNELGVRRETVLVGMVARYHPLKDHATLLDALGMLGPMGDGVRYVLCGRGVVWENEPLAHSIRAAGLEARTHLLGDRGDIPRVLASLDIAVSSSASEALPLAVGEAMACGVPCVVTDVGDSAALVGKSGRVVPPGNPGALAEALTELLALDREGRAHLSRSARGRVRTSYSLKTTAERYAATYRAVTGRGIRVYSD